MWAVGHTDSDLCGCCSWFPISHTLISFIDSSTDKNSAYGDPTLLARRPRTSYSSDLAVSRADSHLLIQEWSCPVLSNYPWSVQANPRIFFFCSDRLNLQRKHCRSAVAHILGSRLGRLSHTLCRWGQGAGPADLDESMWHCGTQGSHPGSDSGAVMMTA